MARTLGDAVFRIRPDLNGFGGELQRGVATSASASGKVFGDRFTRDASGRLRDGNGRFVQGATALGQSGGDAAGKGFKGRFSKFIGGSDLLKPVAAYAGFKGLEAVIGGSIGLAKDFDLTIRQVGVQTGQSGAQLKQLSNLALKMGSDTVFSAKDAGQAMLELAKGGLTAAQIQGGALRSTLLLAAAGGLQLGDAATYVTQGMTTFGLKAADARQVSVALAGGANASTASVQSLGQALSQVGPGARNAGLSIQETVGALAAFDNAGIKGSDAGTSLKTTLQRLIPTTAAAKRAMDQYGLSFVDSSGNIDDLATVAQKLKNRLGPLTQEQRNLALQQIFGSDATRAATVLLNQGRAGIERYTKAAYNQKAAQDLANAAMSGASGATENFQGSVETLGIKIGQKLLPTYTDLTNKASDFVGGMTDGTGAGGQFVDTLDDLYGAAKPVLQVLGSVAHAVGSLPGPVKSLAVEAGIAALILPRLNSALGGASSKALGALSGFQRFRGELASTETRSAAIGGALNRLGGAARSAAGVGGMVLLAQSASQSNRSLSILEGTAGAAALGFSLAGPWGAVAGAGLALGKVVYQTHHASDAFRGTEGDVKNYAATLDQVSGAATKATRALVLQNLQQKGILAQGLKAGLSQQTLVAATMGDPAATDRIKTAVAGLRAEARGLKKDTQDAGTQALFGSDSGKKALADNEKQIKNNKLAVDALSSTYGSNAAALRKAAADARIAAAATADLSKGYRNVPKNVTTALKADGVPHSLDEVTKLARQYNLTPKQIQTVANLVGFDIGKKHANELRDAALGVPKGTTTLAKTPGAPGSKRALDLLTAAAKNADRQHPNIPVSASTKNFFDKLSGALRTANRSSATASLDLNTSAFYAKLRAAASAGASAGGSVGISGRKRAAGGLVKRGTVYQVGEFGRELFTPGTDGRITSTNSSRAALSPERSTRVAVATSASAVEAGAAAGAAAAANFFGGGLVLQIGDEQFDAHLVRKTDSRIRSHQAFVDGQGRTR